MAWTAIRTSSGAAPEPLPPAGGPEGPPDRGLKSGSGGADIIGTMKRKAYESALEALQHQLLGLQRAYVRQGRSAVVVLEGWDAAGKGGLIRRMSWVLDPRTLKVWQTGAPSGREAHQHWMQRFWQRVPLHGEIAVFDRSWYGRVLVERVEGFASDEAWARAFGEINHFERSLAEEGIRIVKLFLDISRETQLDRFIQRYRNPDKRWKLTEEDIRNRARWTDYEQAYADMMSRCSTQWAPWTRIDANDKHEARIAALEAIVGRLGEDVDVVPPELPPLVCAFMDEQLRSSGDD